MKKNVLVFLLLATNILVVNAKWENALAPSVQGIAITLVKNGKADYKIIAGENLEAAKFLRDNLELITGVKFAEDAPFSITFNKNSTDLGVDGYAIEVKEGNIILHGGCDNGIFNAVTAFLEEDLGWRYYQKYQKAISPAGKITEANIVPRRYIPPFYQRMLYSAWAFDPEWVIANKIRMGEYNRKYLVHTTVRNFVTRAEFFATHPEYFAIRNGKRSNQHREGQLCMTNPEVRQIVAQRAIKVIKDTPGIEFLSISQGDNDDYCMCPACSELLKKEEHPSGPLLHFINAVASDIAKVYPKVIITTLAYRYTMDAPKEVKPADNVMVQFMTIERIGKYPFSFVRDTADLERLNDWSKVTNNRLLVWDHMTNYRHYLLPRADLPVLEENIRLYRDKKVFGIMLLANYNNELGTQAAMRTWICTKLLWNPDWDIEKLANDYINGFFGEKIAPFMLEYNTLLINEWKRYHAEEKTGAPFRFFENFYNKASDLIKKAVAAVDNNPMLVKELELEELTLDYYLLEKGITKVADIPSYQNIIDHFSSQIKKYNIMLIKESSYNKVQEKINSYRDGISLVKYTETLPDGCIVLPATWNCYATAKFTTVIEDNESLIGHSIKQQPDGKWYIQWRFEDFPQLVQGKYKVRIRVRADKKSLTGHGATVGVKNTHTESIVLTHSIKAQDLDAEKFKWIDCGIFEYNLDPMYLYTATIEDGAFSAFYVDAVEFIPQEKANKLNVPKAKTAPVIDGNPDDKS